MTTNNIYELYPIYDSRKSFYGKAYVKIANDNIKYLISYDTCIAAIKNGQCYCNGIYSLTSTRHAKEFFKQETGRSYTTKELKNLPSISEAEIEMDLKN